MQETGFYPSSEKIPHASEQPARGPQLLSPHSRAWERQLLSPSTELPSPSTMTTEACVTRAYALQEEKPLR